MKVRVVAHNGKLIMMPSEPDAGIGEGWFPTGTKGHADRIGCVVLDTKNQLGVSKEALKLMKLIKNSYDDIGDIDWFRCADGTHAFSWIGPIYRVIDPKKAESARKTQPYPDQCTIIPNEVPELAKLAVKNGADFWRMPIAINDEPDEPACSTTRVVDRGSHRGGFETVLCVKSQGHEGLHQDKDGDTWDDKSEEATSPQREHEPPQCNACALAPKLSYKCEIYKGFSCNQLIAAYNAGRADLAAEVGRTWPEAEEADLEPEEVISRVAVLLEQEAKTNDQSH